MRVAMTQMDMKLGEPKKNFAHAEELVHQACVITLEKVRSSINVCYDRKPESYHR